MEQGNAALEYDVVIFDLDGTLTESEPGIVSSVKYALDRLGIGGIGDEALRSFIGPPLQQSFIEQLGLTEERARQGVEFYRERFSRIGWMENSVYPGIPALLRDLKAGGAYLAVATAKPDQFTHLILEHFGLRQYFSRVIATQLTDGHVDKRELVARALPGEYRHAAMVGDRKFDMHGGAGNGIDAIGALYGYGSPAELLEAGATHLAGSVSELRRLLLGDGAPQRGRFITLEGLDGCGKSTQHRLLADWLRASGHELVETREPGGCPISERIRSLVLDVKADGMCDLTEAYLFAAARAQHVRQVILPALQRGAVVLCDRYIDSNVAYQGAGRGLGAEAVRSLNAPAVDGCMPDLTLLLSIDPAEAMRRRREAGECDRIEREPLDFVWRVADGYARIHEEEPERVCLVDAACARERVFDDIKRAVAAIL